MHAVDTNVLVRLLTRDDRKQFATALLFARGGAWVSHVVLNEVVWVLATRYSLSAADIIGAVERLIDDYGIAVEDERVVRAALDQYRRRPSLGFSDCLILEIARRAGHLPLATFDRTLGSLDAAQRLL